LALGYATGFVVVLATVLAFAYWSTARHADQRTDEMLTAELAGLRGVHGRAGIAGLATEIGWRVKDYARDGVHYLLRAPDGRPVAGDLPVRSIAAVPASGDPVVVLAGPPDDDPRARPSAIRVLGTRLPGGSLLFVGHVLHVERAILTHALRVYSVTASVAALLILAAGGILGLRVVRRIDTVSRTAGRIMAGDLGQRVPADGAGDEFSDLATTLNQMLARIETLLGRVREVSDNVAHDLRSPLARLRSNLEVTLLQPRTADEYREAIRREIGDSEDLLGTFNALLSIARAEAGPRDAALPIIDLRDVVAETAEIYEALAAEGGIALDLDSGEQPVAVRADTQLLAQALCNLLDNAIKYTPRGGSIKVGVVLSANSARVEVADSGPGIPPEQRDHVLERFVRLDQARRLPGNGLGLSLVNAVVEYHRARMRLEDNEPGLRVRIEFVGLPLTRSDPRLPRLPAGAGVAVATAGRG